MDIVSVIGAFCGLNTLAICWLLLLISRNIDPGKGALDYTARDMAAKNRNEIASIREELRDSSLWEHLKGLSDEAISDIIEDAFPEIESNDDTK
jgi:hypothetical protein